MCFTVLLFRSIQALLLNETFFSLKHTSVVLKAMDRQYSASVFALHSRQGEDKGDPR